MVYQLKLTALSILVGLTTPALYCMQSEMETVAKKAHQEVYINFITSDKQVFKVPLSFINTSKSLKQLSKSTFADLESTPEPIDRSSNIADCSQKILESGLITSDMWRIIEPLYETITQLHQLKKEMRKLKEEYRYLEPKNIEIILKGISEKRKGEIQQKYPMLKTFTDNELMDLLASIRQKIGVLKKIRAELYTRLYFAIKELSYQQFVQLITVVDFCEIPCLTSILITMSYRLVRLSTAVAPDERFLLPQLLSDKIARHAQVKNNSPLTWACGHGMALVVKDLIEKEAAPLEKQSLRGTPLHNAAQNDHTEIVAYLLSKKASTIAKNRRNFTPIASACACAGPETIKLLLGTGDFLVEVSTPLPQANGVFLEIIENPETGYREIFPTHLSYDTLLHLASRNRECAQLVYDYYHQSVPHLLEYRDDRGNTPFLRAIKQGSLGAARFFVSKGANICATDKAHCTALHSACLLDDAAAIVHYLANLEGMNLGQRDDYGKTPLQIAAERNNLKLVQFLMEECGRGFEDLKYKNLDAYNEPVQGYLKQLNKL